jgi:hypothetical protein
LIYLHKGGRYETLDFTSQKSVVKTMKVLGNNFPELWHNRISDCIQIGYLVNEDYHLVRYGGRKNMTKMKIKIKDQGLKARLPRANLHGLFMNEDGKRAHCLFIKDSNELIAINIEREMRGHKEIFVVTNYTTLKQFDDVVLCWPIIAYSQQRTFIDFHNID